jgi:5-methylphenazine-1-carboxylate 1-monooxygenase
MNIIIVGGGIGGLCAALSLHKVGFKVKVFEAAKEMKPLGVGINTLPHCVRVLTQLGLQEKIADKAIETSHLVYFNKLGQKFWSEPRGRNAGYKWPQFSVHRGYLQMLLYNEVKEKLGPNSIIENHHFAYFEQNENEVSAYFVDKQTGQTIHTETADMLIGADGINSMVRQQLYPNEGPAKYSDNVLYRGTTTMPPYLDGQSMAMIGSMQQKMVVYPISKTDSNGHALINWVANLKEGASSLLARDWNRQADKQQLVDKYKNWNFDWLNVPEMIQNAAAVYEFPMSDRDPLPAWSFGRVTLLGDAAQPMYPIGSNGASQAILDANCITECLLQNKNIFAALKMYDAERVPATTKIVLQNRAKGPDEIMDMMEGWFPNGFAEDQIPKQALSKVMDNYRKIAGFDVETLNKKNL